MGLDQPNSPPHPTQGQNNVPPNDVSLPPLSREEWEYNRYNPGSLPRAYPASTSTQSNYTPSTEYTAIESNYTKYTSSSAAWEQSGHPYIQPTREYSYPPQPKSSATSFDPIRNSYTDIHNKEALSTSTDRTQAVISPVMSISQLLTSNNTEQEVYSPTITTTHDTVHTHPQIYSFEHDHQRRNGIQNLLNSDNEEQYQMADSDTDTEDIPLIKSPKEPTSPMVSMDTEDEELLEEEYKTHTIVPTLEDSDSSMDDMSDMEMKTQLKSGMTDYELSDESDDEVYLSHKEEMVQFMIDVHRRRKRVIEEYEKKEALKYAKMKEHIEMLYEKRYGTSMPRREPELSEPPEMEDERHKIWLSIARKDIPRMTRILSRVQATRSGNCKKIAQYCQKEVRRSITNGGRANREMQNKAKKAMKEMLLFWKKNEKEERELRKKAEKEALDRLKQEEERREAQRQARKLNFLITQTELYSHFIGRKIKHDSGEDEDTVPPPPSGLSTPLENQYDLDASVGITPLGDVDFDEEDEDILKEKARLSAQNALAKQREQTREFDEGARERRMAAGDDVAMALDDMNFQDPSSMGSGPEVQQPNMLMCQLKTYQLKGLNWLANLYEQGINGILADEMGLGKTVQSISLLAYLAEVHNIWGPFLVIAPASTLHNWQQEFTKFVPQFRALPYWGNPKDRKILRQFWNRKQLYGKDAPFHIVITSYQLVLTDVTYFQRVKWQYMILDEAQAIKSSSSARWKQLLGFHCRNRLLLTGTPIQNSMQELWALLHFIMPTLFDSHEEFSEWFSKDIESHAENRGSLNEHQLRRLHMILKPFMLRRIKRNVQHELGEKIEVEVYCELTARQRALYRGLKEKISISELLEKATSLGDMENMDSLMNLVMQFRKVCNHPELFERGDVQAPLSFCRFSETASLTKETSLTCPYSASSHIKYHIPKRLYRNGGILKTVSPDTRAGFDTKYLQNLMSIWNNKHIHDSSLSSDPNAAFSFLRFVDMSPYEVNYLVHANTVQRWMDYLSKREMRARRTFFQDHPSAPINTYALFLITDTSLFPSFPILQQYAHTAYVYSQCYLPAAQAVPVDIICDDVSFIREKRQAMFDQNIRSSFYGTPEYMDPTNKKASSDVAIVKRQTDKGIMTIPDHGFSWMKVPSMKDLILDSGKLATMDKLLDRLKQEGHRCLIYFQMTRMIDLFEEYIAYKQYKYLRLDGSSKISDRRDMVQDWQTRPEIFIFLLSTRAGGLGINLTAADTVIFYDSDWNPTVDQQAMDRAHRLGQTKQVTVYRLITKGTIEERILQRAKQKDEIQKVVISGGEFRQVDFKPREIVSLLLDDEELEDKLQYQLKQKVEDEQKKVIKSNKRSRKQTLADESATSTPALSPSNVDRLFSAGEDTFNMDEETPVAKKAKASRIGRPRTNFSFTG